MSRIITMERLVTKILVLLANLLPYLSPYIMREAQSEKIRELQEKCAHKWYSFKKGRVHVVKGIQCSKCGLMKIFSK